MTDNSIDSERPELGSESVESNGTPTKHELNLRVLRVEERQIQTVETLERLNNSIQNDLTSIEQTQEEIKAKHDRLWYMYQAMKYAGTSAGLVALATAVYSLV